MRLTIDTKTGTIEPDNGIGAVDLYSAEGFDLLSHLWLRVGWQQRYSYQFTWMGRPIIQLPEDVLRLQEVVFSVRPEVIVETGIAHGGSLVFHAAMLKAMGGGRVVGVDIAIRPDNRKALEDHELSAAIHLVQGDSAATEVVAEVARLIGDDTPVLVILDSDHSREHVAKELEAYAPLVTHGSYVVVTDGVMQDLYDLPAGDLAWEADNPVQATKDFLTRHPEFELVEWRPRFNESRVTTQLTYWPSAWLRRRPD
jgi:cephalosporin hydroxylase